MSRLGRSPALTSADDHSMPRSIVRSTAATPAHWLVQDMAPDSVTCTPANPAGSTREHTPFSFHVWLSSSADHERRAHPARRRSARHPPLSTTRGTISSTSRRLISEVDYFHYRWTKVSASFAPQLVSRQSKQNHSLIDCVLLSPLDARVELVLVK